MSAGPVLLTAPDEQQRTEADQRYDGDDEHDNVTHTGLTFSRLNAAGALFACAKELAMHELLEAQKG